MDEIQEPVFPDQAARPAAPKRTLVGTLDLREERAVITRQRELAGQVTVRREVQVRTETVTVELRREILVIEVNAGAPEVTVNGVYISTSHVNIYTYLVSV